MNMNISYYITDFGAKGDNCSINTQAIQDAINSCANNGGGTVIVPAGVFISGTVELKSHITLYLCPGAVLKGADDLKEYRANEFSHNEMGKTISLLYSIGHSNIRITGQGEIDFSGDAFMDYDRIHPHEIPGSELNEEQKQEAAVKSLDRPTQPVFFHKCKNVRIDGITLRNSPCWTITFSTCCDIKVHNISIYNGLRVPNSDGIHICSSKDVIITGCVFSCGDDCIAITGITNWDDVSERIVISNCTMRSRSSAMRFGHAASKVCSIVVSNILVCESNRGIAVFAGNEGWVRNVRISNVSMDTHIYAGSWWGKGEPLVICAAESDGIIEDITVSSITAYSDNGIIIAGHRKNIRNVSLKDWDIKIRYGKGENRLLYGGMLDLAPAPKRPAPKGKIPWLYVEDIEDLYLCNIRYMKDRSGDADFSIEAVADNPERVNCMCMEL